MTINKYQAKRNFARTKEPSAKVKKFSRNRPVFVIQKHAASRLHYDFRIEAEGVLKSWAVPKGLPSVAGEKRLAMMVEDHPYDYMDFEGTIPKGNYGAGTVMVWDEGTYELPEKTDSLIESKIMSGIDGGKIHLVLKGKKACGEFALVRTKQADNSWLMFKKNDHCAGKISDDDHSVKSGRTMEEIAAGTVKLDLRNIPGAFKSRMPADILPMKAKIADSPFDDHGYVFEIKWDGYRAMAYKKGNEVELRSRSGKSFNLAYPEIVENLRKIHVEEAVFDGEIVALGEDGIPKFEWLQDWAKDPRGYLVFQIFDAPYLDGYDVRNVPLTKRKEVLKSLDFNGSLRMTDYFEHFGKLFFEVAKKNGIEGIMAKKNDSTYQSGRRSDDWLKIKAVKKQEAVVAGYTEPRGARKKMGALVLGVYEENDLSYIGHTGGGFNEKTLGEAIDKLKEMETSICPFSKAPKTNAPVHWVRPEMVVEIKFSNWTKDGIARQPIFLGFRPDKEPHEVVRETELSVNNKSSKEYGRENGKTFFAPRNEIKLTNPEKVFYPEEQFTKADVAEYYQKISPYILPYLKDRPESLNRHPNGIGGKNFFQKDMRNAPPDWVRTEKIYSESNDKYINYLICQDEATLLYIVNLGAIEINVWNSKVPKLDNPDYMVIDLDPEGVEIRDVIRVARSVHEVLSGIGATSFPKTSGSRGIHIYVPLGAKYTFDQAEQFAHLVALAVNLHLPEITSLIRSPKKRQGKVYIDYLQNGRGKTMAAPYSLRPKPGAPVSTPLSWDEVKSGLDPKKFNIKTIFGRLQSSGDLFKGVVGKGIDMEKALKALEKTLK